MYTEILKIIEGGLRKDPQKVISYTQMLIEKLKKDGEGRFADTLTKLISQKYAQTVTMDELLNVPVDHESRMNIVDIYIPSSGKEHDVVLPPHLSMKLQEFASTIAFRDELKRKGVETNASLLLYGAPGVGKTTIAKYISEKTGLPLVIARFDAIVSSLLGNTAKNIRKIFEFADKKPSILFLDEFDAIAKARDDQYELGELKRVINSLLQNIDLFAQNNVLIAATNHPELLDKAIWRRFNSVIEVEKPRDSEIEKMFSLFVRQFDNDIFSDVKRMKKLVDLFNGLTPSDIKQIINNSVATSIINKKSELLYEDLLAEYYQFKHHGKTVIDELVYFLSENGVPQRDISQKLEISLRQIRNALGDKTNSDHGEELTN